MPFGFCLRVSVKIMKREGLKDTPQRIARMCEEIYGGMDIDVSEYLNQTPAAAMKWFLKKISHFTRCVSTI